MIEKKGFVIEVSFKNLFIGLFSAIMALAGIFVYTSIVSGRVSFAASPYPRQDRAILLLLAWSLISCSFFILAPNRTGIRAALCVFIGLYMAQALNTGTWMVFESTGDQILLVASSVKLLIAPVFLCVVLVYLLYHGVSGQEFFKAVIFSLIVIGILILSSKTGLI